MRQLALTAQRFPFTVEFTVSKRPCTLAYVANETPSGSYVAMFAISSELLVWSLGP